MKITIVGGGSTYTAGIVMAVLEKERELPVSEIYLYDIDFERNYRMYCIVSHLVRDKKVIISKGDNYEEAFTNCSFVFCQIRVGGQKMREYDEKIPLKYNLIGQETCGLGGFSYALRTIGPMLEIVENIQQYSPDAWLLNYTNPESIIASSLNRCFPNMNIINACDMTIAMEEVISLNYGYNHKTWKKTYYGLNHFGWYSSIIDRETNKELLPGILESISKKSLDVTLFGETDQSWIKQYRRIQDMIKVFPEYLPNLYMQYYFLPRSILKDTNKNYTRANMVMDGREKNMEILFKKFENGNEIDLKNLGGVHGRYIVDIASSIYNNLDDEFILIVKNKSSLQNVNSNAMVEVPCKVNKDGARSTLNNYKIDLLHLNLLERQILSEKFLVDGYFLQSYDLILKSFCLNQTVDDISIAKSVLDEFIVINNNYWPELK